MITPALDTVYRRTEYRFVAADSIEILKIGEANPRADALLQVLKHSTLAFITNFNPRGEVYSDHANGKRNEALQRWLQSRGIHFFVGLGAPPAETDWQPETSFAITGISQYEADRIARDCEQLAYVWHTIGAKSALIYSGIKPAPDTDHTTAAK